jgi:hypothetical protein
MADLENLGLTESQDDSVDDTPEERRAAVRQQFLTQWQWPIAFGPFLILVIVIQLPIANSLPNWVGEMVLPLMFIGVIWAIAFKGYLLYLNYQK